MRSNRGRVDTWRAGLKGAPRLCAEWAEIAAARVGGLCEDDRSEQGGRCGRNAVTAGLTRCGQG